MKKYLFILFFILTCFFSSDIFSQDLKQKEVGSPPLQNISSTDYNAGAEIRFIMKSSKGLIYAASNSGHILEYDGISWKKIHSSCNYIYAMVEDENGNIHVSDGFENCAGYLRPKAPTGEWEFVDVRPNLADSIWAKVATTHVGKINNQIYYSFTAIGIEEIGAHIIYKFENGKLNEAFRINRTDIKRTFFTKKNVLFSNGKQLFYKKNIDSKKTIYDSLLQTSYFETSDIYKVLDYSDTELLLFTFDTEVVIYNLETNKISFFGDKATQNALKEAQIISAYKKSDGTWVFGSIQKGIIQTDLKRNIVRSISTKEGLIGNIIMDFAQDNQNQLWIALYNGISKVDISIPLGYWGEKKGVIGNSVYALTRYQNTIFAGTITDLIFLGDDGNWKAIERTPIENRFFQKLVLEDGKEHLFMGAVDGLYEIQKDKNNQWELRPIYTEKTQLRVSFIHNFIEKPNQIYIGGVQGGIGYIEYGKENKKISVIPFLEKLNMQIAFSKNDFFWGIKKEGTTQYIAKTSLKEEKIIVYPKESNFCAFIDEEMNIFQTSTDSVFRIEKDNSISLNKELTSLFKGYSFENLLIKQTNKNTIWVYNPQDLFTHIYSKTKKGYQRNTKLEQALSNYFIRALYEDENNSNVVWIGTSTGILRLDLENQALETEATTFSSIIRRVKIGNDSLIFAGNYFTSSKAENDSTSYKIVSNQSEKDIITVDYEHNSISFDVASLFFIQEKRTQYSYFLEGLDEKWSDWTSLNVKEYNNLQEGNYTFKTKSKNHLGQESTEATYQFRVLPPWQRTTTAYILYVILGIGLVFGSARLYTNRLRQQNEQLENLVSERTDELSQKNTELSTQNDEIVQQRDQLNIKNHKIEDQNKNIVASINYAKRIQTALLPIEDRIVQDIPEHFIFYKPRDIVSGDFYWIEKVEDKVIIAVADCTGHGVPGAFMSMLGSSGLTDAVFQQNFTKPDLILTHLHNYIFSALKQNQSDNRDGMDICIVVWDKKQNQIEYAGAMNPLYYVQNKTLFEIKADKIPVGGRVAKERIYTSHTINLDIPTTIYLASDGYQDQFGGADNRKFMTKQFRELLLKTSHLPIKEQEKNISQAFENWKGNTDQIDDVLVMGMKIG